MLDSVFTTVFINLDVHNYTVHIIWIIKCPDLIDVSSFSL